MASYVVMEPADAASGPGASSASRAVLVRDGFHFLAFLVPVLWLLFHRLWIEALLVIAATLALSGLGSVAGLGAASPALTLLLSLYIGLEGSALKLAAMRRRGWRDGGIFEAENARDAEIRYVLALRHEEAASVEKQAPMPASQTVPAQSQGPALGLFSYPGHN